ncbi:MAG: hypothetical protein WCG79_05095 [Verrucomicrobiota bacterium]
MPSNAKKKPLLILAVKILLLIMTVLLLLAGLFVALPRDPTSYYNGFKIKDDLLRTTRSPKIILVGGSNLAFGINSDELFHEFGVNVVNNGLHASLGLSFMLNSTERYIQTSDVVIIAFEYSHYFREPCGDKVLCELLFEAPMALQYLDYEHLPTVVENLGRVCEQRLAWCSHRMPFKRGEIYHSKAFNQYGDVISHLDKQPEYVEPVSGLWENVTINSAVLGRLEHFISQAEKRGAHVYLFPPCLRKQDYEVNAQVIENLYQTLKKTFPKQAGATPQEFIFDKNDYCFDTSSHLNKNGREIRTATLLEYMRAASVRDGWILNKQTSSNIP